MKGKAGRDARPFAFWAPGMGYCCACIAHIAMSVAHEGMRFPRAVSEGASFMIDGGADAWRDASNRLVRRVCGGQGAILKGSLVPIACGCVREPEADGIFQGGSREA